MELIALLKGDAGARPPLLLVGFDRVVPVQREVFDAWGAWRQATAGEHAEVVQYHLAEEMGVNWPRVRNGAGGNWQRTQRCGCWWLRRTRPRGGARWSGRFLKDWARRAAAV